MGTVVLASSASWGVAAKLGQSTTVGVLLRAPVPSGCEILLAQVNAWTNVSSLQMAVARPWAKVWSS